MPSYFLAETCKYAFLTADSTFWKVSALFTSCTSIIIAGSCWGLAIALNPA